MPVARMPRGCFALFALAFLLMQVRGAAAQSPLDGALKAIPADAQAAIIIPHLKALSDQFTQCLEGMDRANLLMGSRPLDQLKSATGFNTGVDDLGGAAWVLPAGPAETMPVLVIAVSDPKAFLDGNFASHEGDAYKRADGAVSYAKALEKHVVLGPDAAVVKAWTPGEGLGPWLKNSMGERGGVVMYSGEVLLMARGEALARMHQAQKAPAIAGLPGGPQIGAFMQGVAEDIDVAVVTLDVDPLGLITRSFTRFKPGSATAEHAAGGSNSAMGLSRLPNKPFYFALSIDIAGLGGADAMKRLLAWLGVADLPAWVQQSQGLQFAAYPSPAGIAGGLLNDAMAVLATSDPAAARSFIKEQVLASKDRHDGVKREVKWEEQKVVKDAGAADAYEVKVTEAPPGMEQQQMAARLVFGQAGWRGFVRQLDDGVLMTFSQRPAVYQAALAAAMGGKADGSTGIASAGSVKMMRNWMPPHADIEAYLGMGQLGGLMKQVVQSFPMLGDVKLPELDASLPPVGFGLEVGQGGAETTMVIPAGVLAIMFDAAMSQMANAPAPAPPPPSAPPPKNAP